MPSVLQSPACTRSCVRKATSQARAEIERLAFRRTWRPYQQRVLDAATLDLADRKLHVVAAPGSGKTTLALDLAAALLCTAAVEERPCGACRACRLVGDGRHPDVHRVAPDGPGGQIRIDQVRALGTALALHAVEGGARIAIVEHADRLNEDAQHALLKTLEEPPAGVTVVLCADDEDRLLPTIRSRAARIRLGTVALREIEALLGELELAEPPIAGRIARASAGRPGRAVAYARTPEALASREEVTRMLLDLLSAPTARRLEAGRELLLTVRSAAAALETAPERAAATAPLPPPVAPGADGEAGEGAPAARVPDAERRRALAWLIDLWAAVARDLIAIGLGDPRGVLDVGLLDDLGSIAGRVDVGALTQFLDRLVVTSRRLEANISPELALDVLVVT